MCRDRAFLRVLNLFAFTVLASCFAAAQAFNPTSPKRPPNVPADYVVTPFGYFHASCITRLATGDAIREDQNAISHADGSIESTHVCAFPHYAANGEKVALEVAGVEPPTISHAWVEYASVTTSTSSFGELAAHWNVPAAPSTKDGQIIYLFPGMEDYKDVVTIIQPVLGWNSDFSNAWGIASWNCCYSGTVYESSPIRVSSGDIIYGKMTNNCAAGTVSCASWNVTTDDVTLGRSTTLSHTSSHGQTFNWAFAGALEVYNVARCSDYPSNNFIAFYDLALYNDNLARISSPGWTVTNASAGLTPQCNYGGGRPQQVDLDY
jgi:hypothetical protein